MRVRLPLGAYVYIMNYILAFIMIILSFVFLIFSIVNFVVVLFKDKRHLPLIQYKLSVQEYSNEENRNMDRALRRIKYLNKFAPSLQTMKKYAPYKSNKKYKNGN